ncbi:hypothetical protein [Adhaeribacter radiodurans]|uniref:DUF3575 domain-containing protein n=1 Tax=Adhaeribacter radiodurans TaxID=2745197 RepID=A0A7L7L648_9BACT|nr:hypothetical protein [Adhaeribacter radiodurans]QMU28288.1 hypothetical protein HUW48_09695 [Adhaeribacter radiodurans]
MGSAEVQLSLGIIKTRFTVHLNNLSFLLLLILLCFNSSCSIVSHNSGYDANPVFTPFHEKSGEIKASAGYGRVLGIQANASYSFSNRFTVMAGGVYNHQTISTIGIFNSVYFKMKSHYAEGALGYYFLLPGKPFTQVEIFAGLSSGIMNKKTDRTGISRVIRNGEVVIKSHFYKFQ